MAFGLVLALCGGAVMAAAPTLPLGEVRPGLRGVGRTVFHGTTVEEFEVEVLGVLRAAGPTGDLILVRVGGPAIEASGGIAAGMSGSPVYVDGKVMGAISYGFSFADNRMGYVTPIGEMLRVGELAKSGPAAAQDTSSTLPPGLPDVVRLATPVMVGGVGPRGLARLTAVLGPLGLTPVQAGGSAASPDEPQPGLEPGSAFGAQLVSGDMNVTAIGTVTYVDGETFLGFGHPFMNRGKVNMAVTGARIFETVRSIEAPFKVGAPLREVGVLTQDRPAAVAGRLDGRAAAIPLKVVVRDEDAGRETQFQVTVVKDEDLSLDFLGVAALQGLDKGLARIGKGTAQAEFSLTGRGVPGGSLTRSNMYFHPSDISAFALRDFLDGLRLLLQNKFQAVDLEAASLKVDIRGERGTAEIEKAEADRPAVKPGEKVGVTVTVRPYRGEPRRHILTMEIPAGVPAGKVQVVARGGGLLQTGANEEEQGETSAPGKRRKGDGASDRPKTGVENLDKLVQEFLERDKDNDLIVEFWPAIGAAGEGEGEAAAPAFKHPLAGVANPGHPTVARDTLPEEPVRAAMSLPFVLEGSAEFELTILGPDGPPRPPVTPPASTDVSPEAEKRPLWRY